MEVVHLKISLYFFFYILPAITTYISFIKDHEKERPLLKVAGQNGLTSISTCNHRTRRLCLCLTHYSTMSKGISNLPKFTQLDSYRAETTASLLTACGHEFLPISDKSLLCSATMSSSEKTSKVQNSGLSYRQIWLLFRSICNPAPTCLPLCVGLSIL